MTKGLMSIKTKFLLINVLFLFFHSHAYSKNNHDEILLKAIQDQVVSASKCETIAYSLSIKNLTTDKFFKDCVGRRALVIAMQIKYGPGKYGSIDIIDKIDAYTYLESSNNALVQEVASSYSTAAGTN